MDKTDIRMRGCSAGCTRPTFFAVLPRGLFCLWLGEVWPESCMDINAQVHSLYILRRVPQRRNHTMKTNTPIKSIQPAGPDRLINPRGIAVLVSALGLAFLLSTGVTGNPTALYFSTHSFGAMRSRSTTRGVAWSNEHWRPTGHSRSQ